MSLLFQAEIVCDTCGLRMRGSPEHRSTAIKSVYWEAKRLAKKDGWVTLNRSRYRTERHYCRACADNNPTHSPQLMK